LIQDFSYAGYRRGEAGIPTPDRNILNAVTQFGADPTGKSDSTTSIQTSLDAADNAGGYVIGTQGEPDGIELRTTGNSLPLDIAEGKGMGGSLFPPSLYHDQLARRLARRKTHVSDVSKGPSANHSAPDHPDSAASPVATSP
jgi:hypothetical protein